MFDIVLCACACACVLVVCAYVLRFYRQVSVCSDVCMFVCMCVCEHDIFLIVIGACLLVFDQRLSVVDVGSNVLQAIECIDHGIISVVSCTANLDSVCNYMCVAQLILS